MKESLSAEDISDIEEAAKIIREIFDGTTKEEFREMLNKYGNAKGSPGPMHMSRKDYERRVRQREEKEALNNKNAAEQ